MTTCMWINKVEMTTIEYSNNDIIIRGDGAECCVLTFRDSKERGKFVDALQFTETDYCIVKDAKYIKEVVNEG